LNLKANHYAPILFGVILLLSGISSTLLNLVSKISENAFLSVTIIQFLVYLLPLAFYCRVRGLNLVSTVKMSHVPPKKYSLLLILGVIFAVGVLLFRYFGLFFFDSALVDTPTALYIPMDAENAFLVFLCNVLLTAVFEESIFRGVVLEEYRSYGAVWAVTASAVMFAMIHLSLENFVYYFFMGILFGTVAVVADSLLPSIVLHVMVNFSYLHFRPSVVEYLRYAGRSPLLPYLLLALFLLLFVLLFSRLEAIYRDRVYEELLESRKELLRKEVELARKKREPVRRKSVFSRLLPLKEIFLSPTFVTVLVIYLCLVLKIFS